MEGGKSYNQLRLDGALPEGVRDEQDYQEYLAEQQARANEAAQAEAAEAARDLGAEYRQMRMDGTLPEGVRDEQDYREFVAEQRARKNEAEKNAELTREEKREMGEEALKDEDVIMTSGEQEGFQPGVLVGMPQDVAGEGTQDFQPPMVIDQPVEEPRDFQAPMVVEQPTEQQLENIFGKNLNAVQVDTAGENSEAIEQMAMRAVQQRMNVEQKTNRNIGQLLLGGLRSQQGRDLNHEFWAQNGRIKGLGKAIVNTVKYGVLKPFTMGKALREERKKIIESGNIYAGTAEDGGEAANAAIAERFAKADAEDDKAVKYTLLGPDSKINKVEDDDVRLKHIRSQLANLANKVYDANGNAEAEAAALEAYNKFLSEQRDGGDLDKFATSADNFTEMGINVLNNTKEAMTKAGMSREAIANYIRDHVSFAEGSARVGVNTKAELDRTTKLLGSAAAGGIIGGAVAFGAQKGARSLLKSGVTTAAIALAASTGGAAIIGAAAGGAVFGALRGRQRGKEAVSNREYDRILSGAEGGSGEGEKDKIGYEFTTNAMKEMVEMRALLDSGDMDEKTRKILSYQLAGLYARIGRGAEEGADLISYDVDGDAGKLEEQRTALLNTMAEARQKLGKDGEAQLLDDIAEWNEKIDEDIEDTNRRRSGYVARRAALSGVVGGVAAGTAAAIGQAVRGALNDDTADTLEDKTDTALEDGGDELQAPEYDLTTMASTKVNIIKNGDEEGGYEVFANTEGDDDVMEQVMVNGHELAIQFKNDGSGELTDETLRDMQAAGFKAFVDTDGNGQYEAVEISEAGDMMYTGELTGESTIASTIANARLYMESLQEGATNPELGGAGVQNVNVTEWAGKGEEVWLGQPTLSADGTKYVIDLMPRDGNMAKLEGLEVALTPSEATAKALTYEVTDGKIEIDVDSVGASMISHDDAGAASLAAFKSQVIENLENGGVKSWGTATGKGVESFQVNSVVESTKTVPQYSFLYGDQRVDITPPAATYSEAVGANESYFTEFYNSGNAEVIATDQNITLNGQTLNGVRIDGGYDNTLNTFNTQAAERITAHNNGAPLYEGVGPQGQEVAMAREYAEEIVTNPHDAALMRAAFGMDNGDGAGANGTIDDINELNSYVNNVLMGGDNDGYDAITNDTVDEYMARLNGGSVELIDATTTFRASVYEYRGANDMTITMGVANRIMNKGDEHFMVLRDAAGDNIFMKDPAQIARLRDLLNVPKDATDVQFVINPACRQLTAVYNMPDTPTTVTSDIIAETPVSNRAEETTVSNPNQEVSVSNAAEEVSVSNAGEEVSVSNAAEEVSVSNAAEEVSVSNAGEEVSVSNAAEEVSVSNANEEISVSNVNEEVSVSNANEEISVSAANEEISVSNVNEEVSVSDANEEVSVSDPAEEVSVSDPTAEVSVSNPTEEVSVSDANEEVSVSDAVEEVSVSDPAEEVSVSDPTAETSLEPKDPDELEDNMGNDRTDEQNLDDDVTPPTDEPDNKPGDYDRDDGTFGEAESGDGDQGHSTGGEEVVTGQDQNGDDITGHQQNVEENPDTTHSGDGSGRTEQEVIDDADQGHSGDVNRTPEDAAQHEAEAEQNAADQAAQEAADQGAAASESAAEAAAGQTEEEAGSWFDIISGGGQ